MLRFFNYYTLESHHIKALKDSRKVFVKNKIVDYNSNFAELIKMEKGIYVLPKNDEILDMINDIHFLDGWEQFEYSTRVGKWCNYIFEDLPLKLQRYIKDLDFQYYNLSYSKHVSSPDYDRREQRLFSLISEPSMDEYERYVLLGHSIPSTLGKKAKESSRRSFYTVTDLIRSNVHLFKHFVTLTFALEKNKLKYYDKNQNRLPGEVDLNFDYIDPSDFELAKKCFTRSIENLSRKLKRKDIPFYYVAVWELHDNGNYHFHMLCSEIPSDFCYSVPNWLDIDYRNGNRNYGQGLLDWKYGKSDVQLIKSPSRVTTYVSKYIIKSFLNVSVDTYQEYLNKKKFFSSHNLNKSMSTYDDDSTFDNIYNELDLANKNCFTKQYTNLYNDGSITKHVYSLVD